MSSTEKSQSSSSGAQLKVHYAATGFTVPHPDLIARLCEVDHDVFSSESCMVVKISPNVVVKFGPFIDTVEARTMMHIAKETHIPVPTVFACYTYGPTNRDIRHYGSRYDTYICMSFVEGKTLEAAWGSCDAVTKQDITRQLGGFTRQLRELGEGDYIGSIDCGPVLDETLMNSHDNGTTFNVEVKG